MSMLEPAPGRDVIEVVGIRGLGFHGVLPEERRVGQIFTVDVAIGVDVMAASQSDDLDRTVDYSLVAQAAHEEIVGDPVDLIETLAQRIADRCLALSGVRIVAVTVHKPSAPVGVPVSDVVLRIVRERS